MVRHPVTGKYRRTRLFVFTLGYSRKSVRLLTFASSTRRWAELHEETFRRLGGAVRVVVLDNLKEGVLTPDIYDPALNPLYRDVLAHYGAVALPCRVGDPDRKGKVESAIGHTQATPLKGLRFETPRRGGPGLSRSLGGALGRHPHPRHHQAPGRRHVRRGAAAPPPAARWSPFATTSTAPAPCISTAASKSPAPTTRPRRAGSAARSPSNGTSTTSGCSIPPPGTLLREHRRQPRGRHAIHPDDQPRAHAAHARWRCSTRATRAGAAIGTLCAAIHRRDGEPGVRRILGVLALVKKHGAAVVADACAAALELGVADYRFVRRYLERHRAGAPHAAPGRSAHPRAHPLPRRHRAENPGGHRHERRRTATRPAPAPLLRHGRRPRGPPARSPGREAGPHRFPLPPRPGRTPPPPGSPPRTPGDSRRASATSASASTPSTSTSTRR